MKKIIEVWDIPENLKVTRAMVTLEHGCITLEVGGYGFTASLGGRKIEDE